MIDSTNIFPLFWSRPARKRPRGNVMIGTQIYFKLDGWKRSRRGDVIGGDHETGWQVQGLRQPNKFTRDMFIVPTSQIFATEEIKAKSAPSGIREGRHIAAHEMQRRAQVAAERFPFTELQVLQAKVMLEIRRSTLSELAWKNRISATVKDFEFEELTSEYLVATIGALRTATSSATPERLAEFYDHLTGQTRRSRIMGRIARTGRTAAIRYLMKRREYHMMHRDISDYADRLAA
jgi:hypothetical protein